MTRAGAHHYPMVLTDVSAPLEELACWRDLKRVQKAAYRAYLSVDERRVSARLPLSRRARGTGRTPGPMPQSPAGCSCGFRKSVR